jgi:hypothetical protein
MVAMHIDAQKIALRQAASIKARLGVDIASVSILMSVYVLAFISIGVSIMPPVLLSGRAKVAVVLFGIPPYT